MNSVEDVESLEKLIGQLQGAHTEIIVLAKKNPDKTLSAFKVGLINSVIEAANEVLGSKYKPFEEFNKFNSDELPTSSDVTMVISQYMQEAERFRSDNVVRHLSSWYYVIDGKQSSVLSGPPSKVGKK